MKINITGTFKQISDFLNWAKKNDVPVSDSHYFYGEELMYSIIPEWVTDSNKFQSFALQMVLLKNIENFEKLDLSRKDHCAMAKRRCKSISLYHFLVKSGYERVSTNVFTNDYITFAVSGKERMKISVTDGKGSYSIFFASIGQAILNLNQKNEQ